MNPTIENAMKRGRRVGRSLRRSTVFNLVAPSFRLLCLMAKAGVALTVILSSQLWISNPDQAAAFSAQARTSPNLLANPHFKGPSGWEIVDAGRNARGSAYDSAVTRLPGSGSIRLVGHNTSMRSAPVAVVAGKAYTLSAYMMIEKTPSLGFCTVVAMDASSKWLRRVGTDYVAPSRAGQWEEVAYFFAAEPGETSVMLTCGRFEPPYNPNANGAIWFDDAYFGEGASLEQPPSPKRPFDGSAVRADALGNIDVRRNGSWEPFFPFAIYQARGEPYGRYSAQGFNCIMFNQFSLEAVEAARRAVSDLNPYGMMSMIEIAQYMRPDAPLYADVAGVERLTRAIAASRGSENVLAYYWDNEAWSEMDVPRAITDRIKLADRDGDGRRIRPILMLQGNPGMIRQYNDMVDLAMTYNQPVADFILQRIGGQRLPWTLVVFSDIGEPRKLRSGVYRQLALGARGIAYYKDPLDAGPHIEELPIWDEFRNLRIEIERLLPVLRASQWTSWTAASSFPAVTVGTRDYRGEGYLIVCNDEDSAVNFTLSLSGMPYSPSSLIEFFGGRRISLDSRGPAGGSVAISLAAYGAAVYRVEPASATVGPTRSK